MVHFTTHEGAHASALGDRALCHLQGATVPNPHYEDHESRSSPRLVEAMNTRRGNSRRMQEEDVNEGVPPQAPQDPQAPNDEGVMTNMEIRTKGQVPRQRGQDNAAPSSKLLPQPSRGGPRLLKVVVKLLLFHRNWDIMGKLLPKGPRAPPWTVVPLTRRRGARGSALVEGALSSKRQATASRSTSRTTGSGPLHRS
uniref:Uncharacterized protein n=1 Tax=Solanum tuberosum TaxID=4113 RepID=M1DVH6_SOLTU